MDPKKRRRGILLGALAAGATAGLVAERYFVGRDRRRPDPEAKEPFGELRGDPAAVTSFDGTRLHVETHGPATAPTLVFVHGFSLNLSIWHYQVRDLPPAHRLVVYDARGHGKSEKARDGDWSLDALARDLEAVVREHGGPGPVVLVGHSMGGMTVLRFAEMFPEQIGTRVGGLALVNTTAADVMGGMLPGAARRAAAAIQMIQEGAVRALASNAGRVDRLRGRSRDLAYLAVRTMGLGPKALPSVVEFTESVLAETPTEVWASLIPALIALDVSEVLDVIDVPTLIIAGSHDRMTPTGAAARMANAIKGAELSMIRDAGHMSMLERPQSFNARLRGFLARVPTAVG
ncbi:MAG: alpha/beta fold hydrolase [Actinomycetota bacterium]